MVIVDTSVWVDHFRGRDTDLIGVLEEGTALLHPFVFGELLLGGLPGSSAAAHELRDVPPAPLATIAEVETLIDSAKLASAGIGYVDTHLLAAAKLIDGGLLLTSDKSLQAQAIRLGVCFSS